MEAAESAAVGAASASGDGGEGVAGTRRGPAPRQHRRLLSTVQRSNPDPKPPASAAAPGAVHRVDGRVPLHGGGPVPERDLRPRMPPLTAAVEAAVPGSRSLLPGRRHWEGIGPPSPPFERRRILDQLVRLIAAVVPRSLGGGFVCW